MHALDASGGVTDPAVTVHVLAIGSLAVAFWEQRAPLDDLERAVEVTAAWARDNDAEHHSLWARATGPVAAAVLSAVRIGWKVVAQRALADDLGNVWNLLRDSPAAVKRAVAESVRRWRLRQLVKLYPAMQPHPDDCIAGAGIDRIVLDGGRAVGTLLNGARVASVDTVPAWDGECRAWLISGITNGQWPQARRAAVKGWIADNLCQLCKAHVGSLIHRRACPCTMPNDGWGAPPQLAEEFFERLSPQRRHMLQTRGLLALSLPKPLIVDEARVRWITQQPDGCRGDLKIYIDGSLLNARFAEYSTAACALVIVSTQGDLLGIAQCRLPSKVRTAAEAEAYGLALALNFCPALPLLVTDCLALLTTACGGAAADDRPTPFGSLTRRTRSPLLPRLARGRRA